jgi:hypothetical protein
MNETAESLRAKGWTETEKDVWCSPARPSSPQNSISCASEAITGTLMPKTTTKTPPKRLRQRTKPKMNRLEAEFEAYITKLAPPAPKPHAITLTLANGVRYTPDFIQNATGSPMIAYEVKGKHAWDDAIVKLKVAAHEWPPIRFFLVWKDNGQWQSQHILP